MEGFVAQTWCGVEVFHRQFEFRDAWRGRADEALARQGVRPEAGFEPLGCDIASRVAVLHQISVRALAALVRG